MSSESRRSPLALAVLALLVEAPMHPYEMQRLLKQRGKDRVINVGQRASLYKTIDRLHRDGLVAVREVSRAAHRPERTVYEATDAGLSTVREWVREMLAADRDEFPEFPAAIAYLALLEPDDAVHRLQQRRERVAGRLERLTSETANAAGAVPRLFLLENEYLSAMAETELNWIDAVLDDLGSGRLTWTPEWLAEVAGRFRDADGPTRTDEHQGRTS